MWIPDCPVEIPIEALTESIVPCTRQSFERIPADHLYAETA